MLTKNWKYFKIQQKFKTAFWFKKKKKLVVNGIPYSYHIITGTVRPYPPFFFWAKMEAPHPFLHLRPPRFFRWASTSQSSFQILIFISCSFKKILYFSNRKCKICLYHSIFFFLFFQFRISFILFYFVC